LYSARVSCSVTGAPQPSQNRAPSRGSARHVRHAVAAVIRPPPLPAPKAPVHQHKALDGSRNRFEQVAISDRLGAWVPYVVPALPEFSTAITHLPDVVGEATYESLARKGETMTTAAMATYAYDQIDQARTELEAVSN
jgi:hypothetical protein